MDWMIYGASGYTGELIAELARTKGLSPVLAGRSQAKVRPLAEKLGFRWREFGLDKPGLEGMKLKWPKPHEDLATFQKLLGEK